MTKNELLQVKLEKLLKDQARQDAKLLNKHDISEYIRFLLGVGHTFALTQAKKNNNTDYYITEEKIKEWIDKKLKDDTSKRRSL